MWNALVWCNYEDGLKAGHQYLADSAAQINTGKRSMPTDAKRTTNGRMARTLLLMMSKETI